MWTRLSDGSYRLIVTLRDGSNQLIAFTCHQDLLVGDLARAISNHVQDDWMVCADKQPLDPDMLLIGFIDCTMTAISERYEEPADQSELVAPEESVLIQISPPDGK